MYVLGKNDIYWVQYYPCLQVSIGGFGMYPPQKRGDYCILWTFVLFYQIAFAHLACAMT